MQVTTTRTTTRNVKISAHADGGPRSRVCARETLRSAPHRRERKFSGACVYRVTFKHLFWAEQENPRENCGRRKKIKGRVRDPLKGSIDLFIESQGRAVKRPTPRWLIKQNGYRCSEIIHKLFSHLGTKVCSSRGWSVD